LSYVSSNFLVSISTSSSLTLARAAEKIGLSIP
jgi:hypothetical protein